MNDQETLAIETRIDATLFRRRYWGWSGLAPHERRKVSALTSSSLTKRVGCDELSPDDASKWSGGIWNHHKFLSDWSLLEMLTDKCVEKDWPMHVYPHPWGPTGEWQVELNFRGPSGHGDYRVGKGKSLPEALSLAIVAVLDATEGTP